MNAVLADVAAAVSLAEGESGVRAVVQVVAQREPVPVREISRATGLPVPLVAATCNELRKRGVVDSARPVRLTTRGRELFGGLARRLSFTGRCDVCEGTGTRIPAELAPVADALALSAEAAPAAQMQLDQSHCTVETKLRRVLALDDADALVGRSVMLLGDDDLVSLALASVVRRFGSPSTIAGLTVLDNDPAVVAFVRRRLAKAPFPVSCVLQDLRDPLPPGFGSRFDVVLTDPPYTPGGARLFLSRAAAAVRDGGTVFLSFGSRRPEATYVVQRDLARMGFAITSLHPNFNRYVGAGVLGGTSDLYRLLATKDVRPLVSGRYEGPLYTSEA